MHARLTLHPPMPQLDPASRRRFVLRTFGIAGAQLSAELPGPLIMAYLSMTDAVSVGIDIATHAGMVGLTVAMILELHEWRVRVGRPTPLWVTIGAALVLMALVSAFTPVSAGVRLGLAASPTALHLYNFWFGAIVSVLSIVYLTQRRESVLAEGRRRQHELQLDLARRRLSTSKARATQARLDPDILFRCLRDANAVYAVDTDRADRLLDRLTTYLRKALAASTAAANSLAHETETACALVALVALADATTPAAELAISLTPSASASPFPPGALVQLLGAWAETLVPAPLGPGRIALRAERRDGSLQLAMQAPRAPARQAIERCREQLAEMLGSRAFAIEEPATGHVVITLELADEP